MARELTAKTFLDRFVKEMTVGGNYLPCEKSNSKFTRNVKSAVEKIIEDTLEYYTVDHTEFIYDESEEAKARYS